MIEKLNIRSLLLHVLVVSGLLAPSGAAADEYVCTCQQEACGNGGMTATKGKVMSGIPDVSLERMFGPSRTGADKTGWVCESRAQILARQRAQAAAAAGPVEYFTCTCAAETCGGIGIIEGKRNELHKSLIKSAVRTNYAPSRAGSEATGWQCATESGAKLEEPEPPPGPSGGTSGLRYTCSCTRPRCGGADGILEGEQGQRHSGISEARLDPGYGSVRLGEAVTGWACKPESPPPPRPRYACTCSRDSCGGTDGILPGELGQRHTGIPEARLQAGYGPARSGEQATGWSCTQEKAAPVAAPARYSPSGAAYTSAGPRRGARRDDDEEQSEPEGPRRFNLDLLFGAALGIGGASHMGALVLKPALALNSSRTLSLILPLGAQILSDAYVVSFALGLQYDVQITDSLYLTPRFSLGYAASIRKLPAPLSGSGTAHLGSFTPEMGLKYVVSRRVNLGLDFASIPILFDSNGSAAYYRLMGLLGVGF